MEEKKKGNLKWIIIAVVVIVVLIGAGIGGFLAFQASESNKSVGTDWGDIYYAYFEEEKNPENEIKTIDRQAEEYKVQFLSQEEKKPVMIVEYTTKIIENDVEKDQNNFGIFYIDEDNTVGNVTHILREKDKSVELLYNKKEEKYKWYLRDEGENNFTNYTDIEKSIERSKLQKELGGYEKALENEEYKKLENEVCIMFEENDMPLDKIEENTPISKFEETFIVPENVPELAKVTLPNLNDLKNIKEQLTESVKEYKAMEKVATEEVKQSVTEANKKIEDRKATIKKAEEEAKKKAEEEKKKKEEEARKKAEEEAKKGIKAGSYTLKYGTYKSEWGYTYTINANGGFSYNGLGGAKSGTYRVYWYKGYKDEIADEPAGWVITFTSGGDTNTFYIKGNNYFTALQYQDNYRLQ